MTFTDPATISLICLAVCFAVLALLEARQDTYRGADSERRIVTNFTIGIMSMALGAILPFGTVAASLFAGTHGLGLFSLLALPWPAMLAILLLARSLASYGIHRLSHMSPLLWRIHRVHHADRAVDLSTALRNHPLELLPVVLVAAGIVLLLGPPVGVVIAVDGILFAAALWQHADIALPRWLEHWLGGLFVTPSVHRVHHSSSRAEHDRNYGDILILWDRLFGTYASAGLRTAPLGLEAGGHEADRFVAQLASPFR
ncbi:MAG: sterol desaturase family protein [Sphingomonas bacterium]